MASMLCQNGFKKTRFFFDKAKFFVHFERYDLVQMSVACCPKYVSNIHEETIRLSLFAFVRVARISFYGKFTAKIAFSIWYVMLLLMTLTFEV